ncbi:MAG: hypothetical protein FJX29_06325, partial [Alphaproteobacteria bacterium]|nr:hypothetical protein [Alphaproteobacteria bacterium]
TCRALDALWFHAQRAGRTPALPLPPGASDLKADNLDQMLARYGIEGPKSALASDAEGAVSAALRIGFPVALKIRSPDILHKTEAGGVILDLRSEDGVKQAAQKLIASAKAAFPHARMEGFLVQEMVSGVEAIAGVRDDELYGPLLLAGSGGILVELLKDAQLALLPVNREEISRLLDKLKLAKLLAGYRGKPAADRAALEKAIAALAQFYLDHRARIADIEINPLIVREDGKGVCAVDVRVIWRA